MLKDDFFYIQSVNDEQGVISAMLEINPSHKIFQGHFPGQPVVPGVCMMEMVKEITEMVTGKEMFLQKADNILIFGSGPTGLMHMILARFFGVSKILLVDVNSFRLEFAKKIDQQVEVINMANMHEDEFKKKSLKFLGKNGSDVSIISTSNVNAFIQSLSITRKGGTISLFGVPPKDTEVNINLNMIYSKELKILPSYAASEREIHQTIALMEAKIMNFELLITHRFLLKDSHKALAHAHQAIDSMKVIITME